MNKRTGITEEQKKLSYAKYYYEPLAEVPKEKLAALDAPIDPAKALKIQDRNRLFEEGYLDAELGYCVMEDGTGYIANLTPMPGVTVEMFDWWFAWHPIDRLRYACWDSEDHYDVYLDDPLRAVNPNLSIRERHWGSIHNIWEDIGTGTTDLLRIHFMRPRDMGYDESKIDTDACNALVCANVKILGGEEMPDIPVVMTHFLRPVQGGSQLRSRFWFGWQIIDGKAVKSIPDGVRIPSVGPICLLNHNVKEFSNLSKILPELYEREKDHWI